MGAFDETLGDFGHRRIQLDRATIDAFRRPYGGRRNLGVVIAGIGGLATSRLTLVRLDQLAPAAGCCPTSWC